MVGPLHQQMAKPASKVPRAAAVLATTLAPAQGKQDKAATTLQSQRENVGASVAGPASEAPSAAAVPATVLAPVQGKHDKAAATLQSQPEKAPRRKCLLNEHTTTSLSRDQVLTIKRAIRAASTEEEVEKLEKAILNGVMPRGLRSQAGCVAAKAASSSGEALAPAQGKEGPYQVHPDSVYKLPYFEKRKGGWYCRLCKKYATPAHLDTEKHYGKVAWAEWKAGQLDEPSVPAVDLRQDLNTAPSTPKRGGPPAPLVPRTSQPPLRDKPLDVDKIENYRRAKMHHDRSESYRLRAQRPAAKSGGNRRAQEPAQAAMTGGVRRRLRSPLGPPSHLKLSKRWKSWFRLLPGNETSERVEDFPETEEASDPLREAFVERNGCQGRVLGIERGVVSGDKLYLVRFEDNDFEHFTEPELRKYMTPAPGPARQGVAVAASVTAPVAAAATALAPAQGNAACQGRTRSSSSDSSSSGSSESSSSSSSGGSSDGPVSTNANTKQEAGEGTTCMRSQPWVVLASVQGSMQGFRRR